MHKKEWLKTGVGFFALVSIGCINSDVPSIGSKAHLDSPVFVAVSESALDELARAVAIDNKQRVDVMVASGHVYIVTDHPQILILDYESPSKAKIKILTGEYAGRTGWVPFEFIV